MIILLKLGKILWCFMSKKYHLLERTLFHIYPFPGEIMGGGEFGIVEDSTDHFGFYCRNCKVLANVIMIRSVDNGEPRLYFFLHCDKCGGEDFRKIYLRSSAHPILPAFIPRKAEFDKRG